MFFKLAPRIWLSCVFALIILYLKDLGERGRALVSSVGELSHDFFPSSKGLTSFESGISLVRGKHVTEYGEIFYI